MRQAGAAQRMPDAARQTESDVKKGRDCCRKAEHAEFLYLFCISFSGGEALGDHKKIIVGVECAGVISGNAKAQHQDERPYPDGAYQINRVVMHIAILIFPAQMPGYGKKDQKQQGAADLDGDNRDDLANE